MERVLRALDRREWRILDEAEVAPFADITPADLNDANAWWQYMMARLGEERYTRILNALATNQDAVL